MHKLIQGILEFRRDMLPTHRTTFARLAQGQRPDCLMVACSDSRVAPNVFASTQPGDLFVVRNVGNLVPRHGDAPSAESSVPAALEFAVLTLEVRDIVICGHSGCGAMRGLLEPPTGAPHLSAWLDNGWPALVRLRGVGPPNPALPEEDQLSQVNVLEQVAHVEGYPFIRERVAAGNLRVHGWWFDIGAAEVQVYDAASRCFTALDEQHAEQLLAARS